MIENARIHDYYGLEKICGNFNAMFSQMKKHPNLFEIHETDEKLSVNENIVKCTLVLLNDVGDTKVISSFYKPKDSNNLDFWFVILKKKANSTDFTWSFDVFPVVGIDDKIMCEIFDELSKDKNNTYITIKYKGGSI